MRVLVKARAGLRTVYGYVRKVAGVLRVGDVVSYPVYGPLQGPLRYGYGPYTAVNGVNGCRGWPAVFCAFCMCVTSTSVCVDLHE